MEAMKLRFKKRIKGGPFGLGDPEDTTLLELERNQAIPVYHRDIVVREYCSQVENEHDACCENKKWKKFFQCRQEYSSLKACLKKYWNMPHIEKQAEIEYLKDRSEYRQTGIRKSGINDD